MGIYNFFSNKYSSLTLTTYDIDKKQRSFKNNFLNYFKTVGIFAIWVYIVTKLFFFDIDVYAFSKMNPDWVPYLDYKFIVVLLLVSVYWLLYDSKSLRNLLLYIIIFPALSLFWKLPLFLYSKGGWGLCLSLINVGASFYQSIKYNFIFFTLYITSSVLIIVANHHAIILSSCLIIMTLTVTAFIRRMNLAFKPSSLHRTLVNIVSEFKNHKPKPEVQEVIDADLELVKLTESQLTAWTDNLQQLVLFNRICFFAAKKLRDYERTGFHVFSVVFTILVLCIFTVLSFTIINFGLYRYDPSLFNIQSSNPFFSFFLYSFNILVFNSTSQVEAIMPLSQISYVIQTILIFFLVIIFISVVVTEVRQKNSEELQRIVERLKMEGEAMEEIITKKYHFSSIEDAVLELSRLKSSMIGLILKMTDNINR